MKNEERKTEKREKTFDYGTHPGAYVDIRDEDNELLDTVDSADDAFTKKIPAKGKRANPISPPAADPPVPNRAHTEM